MRRLIRRPSAAMVVGMHRLARGVRRDERRRRLAARPQQRGHATTEDGAVTTRRSEQRTHDRQGQESLTARGRTRPGPASARTPRGAGGPREPREPRGHRDLPARLVRVGPAATKSLGNRRRRPARRPKRCPRTVRGKARRRRQRAALRHHQRGRAHGKQPRRPPWRTQPVVCRSPRSRCRNRRELGSAGRRDLPRGRMRWCASSDGHVELARTADDGASYGLCTDWGLSVLAMRQS